MSKRPSPFNELRDTGYIFEGLPPEYECPIHYRAMFIGKESYEGLSSQCIHPRIKSDEQLAEILSSGLNEIWTVARVRKVKNSIQQQDDNCERMRKAKVTYELKMKEQSRIAQPYIEVMVEKKEEKPNFNPLGFITDTSAEGLW